MTTNFKVMGEMLGFFMDRSALEQLGIDEETPIFVTTDSEGIHLRPMRFASTEEVEQVTISLMEAHSQTLTRLAE